MDGGGGGSNHMNKGIFKIFVEEFLVVFPMAVIVTALSLLSCMALPQSEALPLCTVCSALGVIRSLSTTGSNIRYMIRYFPYGMCEPEGKFAHFCMQFDYLVCNGVLIALGLIAYGEAFKYLEIDFKTSKEKDDIMQHKVMLRTGIVFGNYHRQDYIFCCGHFMLQLFIILFSTNLYSNSSRALSSDLSL
jgi:hypothetical protein